MSDSSKSMAGNSEKERRRFRRYVVPMHVVAVRREVQSPVEKPRTVGLHVKDISKGGLCGVLGEQVSCDEELMLFIPPQGGRGGRDVCGRVLRCDQIETHYRVGIAFSDPLGEAGSCLH